MQGASLPPSWPRSTRSLPIITSQLTPTAQETIDRTANMFRHVQLRRPPTRTPTAVPTMLLVARAWLSAIWFLDAQATHTRTPLLS